MIKNPVNDHLPTGCPKFAMSYSAEEIIDVRDVVPKDGPAVFVIGAMAHGSVSCILLQKLLLLFDCYFSYMKKIISLVQLLNVVI